MSVLMVHNNQAFNVRNVAKHGGQMVTASAISLVIFYGMAQLVAPQRLGHHPLPPTTVVELMQPRQERPPEFKKVLPEKPLPPQQPPMAKSLLTTSDSGLDVKPIDTVLPPINLGVSDSNGVQAPEQDATPVVRMEPKYPVDAARDGVEGWVELRFSIDTAGQVQDVQVVNAEPRRIFDKAAVQALKRWKYRPKVVDGKAIAQTGLAVRLDFNLDNQ